MEARIEASLGFPTHDPHGDPIPNADGIVQPLAGATLDHLPIGVQARIERAVDRDPDRLRYLGELGLYPGAIVVLLEMMPFDGPLRIQVGDREHIIGRSLASAIYATAMSN
jgi:DtxR family Mn-dependent transcriptional regulator